MYPMQKLMVASDIEALDRGDVIVWNQWKETKLLCDSGLLGHFQEKVQLIHYRYSHSLW